MFQLLLKYYPKEVVKNVKDFNPDEIILMPLYPQYSAATSGSSIKEWKDICKKSNLKVKTSTICCYPTDENFVQAHKEEIINNDVFIAHFIVAKCDGFVASENKLKQGIGLVKSMLSNRIGRSLLTSQYERYIFQHKHSDLVIHDPYNFSTTKLNLSQNNIKGALLASGAIPMVMQGIRDIAECPQGMYRDGGIVDYHFDFEIKKDTQCLPILATAVYNGGQDSAIDFIKYFNSKP